MITGFGIGRREVHGVEDVVAAFDTVNVRSMRVSLRTVHVGIEVYF